MAFIPGPHRAPRSNRTVAPTPAVLGPRLGPAHQRALATAWLACAAAVMLPMHVAAQPTATAGPAATSCPALLKHTLPRLQDEAPQALCQYAGKVLLVVNTASQCGYTPQYKGLEALHAKYAARGLVVMGFPSNDFGGQEPGDAKQIGDTCFNFYGVRFPMFSKVTVKGAQAEMIYVDVSEYENGYSIRGTYGYEGDGVVVKGSLFKGKTLVGKFEVRGKKSNLPGLVEGIVGKVEGMVK